MKGLLRNDFYITLSNAKIFSGIMVLLGTFVVAMDNTIPSLVIGYILLAMIGFSISAISGLRKESISKWSKYKLTAPVKRADIIKSHFLSQLFWMIIGMFFAGVVTGLSIVLHGFPFDKNTDVYMLFVAGIGISLFMGAIFFPLFYLGGEERNEVFLVISLLCGIGILLELSTLINSFFHAPMTTSQVILGGLIILACALLTFSLSYPLTVDIFRKKEY